MSDLIEIPENKHFLTITVKERQGQFYLLDIRLRGDENWIVLEDVKLKVGDSFTLHHGEGFPPEETPWFKFSKYPRGILDILVGAESFI